ncbi:mucin-4-like [Teleopsis dalmanni]|uniref:mucin-4-like n=1 Tax=Teleopsis dalmanni TaxID=139649 RepID=UPI0018CF3686|nr:mucin-4-like [Teleopsis dalmanni]
MSEKSRADTSTNTVRVQTQNPLLSPAVTGLIIDTPIILPAAPPIHSIPVTLNREPKSLVVVGKPSQIDTENLDEVNLNSSSEDTQPAQIDTNSNPLLEQNTTSSDSILSQAASSFSALPSVASSVFSTFSKRIYSGSSSRELTPSTEHISTDTNANFQGQLNIQPAYIQPQQVPPPPQILHYQQTVPQQQQLPFLQQSVTPSQVDYPAVLPPPPTLLQSSVNNNNQNALIDQVNAPLPDFSSVPTVEPPKLYTPTDVPTLPTVSAPPSLGQNTYRLKAKKKIYAPIPGFSQQTFQPTPVIDPLAVNAPISYQESQFPQTEVNQPTNFTSSDTFFQLQPQQQQQQQSYAPPAQEVRKGGLFSLTNLVPTGVLQNISGLVQSAADTLTQTIKSEPSQPISTPQLYQQPYTSEPYNTNYFGQTLPPTQNVEPPSAVPFQPSTYNINQIPGTNSSVADQNITSTVPPSNIQVTTTGNVIPDINQNAAAFFHTSLPATASIPTTSVPAPPQQNIQIGEVNKPLSALNIFSPITESNTLSTILQPTESTEPTNLFKLNTDNSQSLNTALEPKFTTDSDAFPTATQPAGGIPPAAGVSSLGHIQLQNPPSSTTAPHQLPPISSGPVSFRLQKKPTSTNVSETASLVFNQPLVPQQQYPLIPPAIFNPFDAPVLTVGGNFNTQSNIVQSGNYFIQESVPLVVPENPSINATEVKHTAANILEPTNILETVELSTTLKETQSINSPSAIEEIKAVDINVSAPIIEHSNQQDSQEHNLKSECQLSSDTVGLIDKQDQVFSSSVIGPGIDQATDDLGHNLKTLSVETETKTKDLANFLPPPPHTPTQRGAVNPYKRETVRSHATAAVSQSNLANFFTPVPANNAGGSEFNFFATSTTTEPINSINSSFQTTQQESQTSETTQLTNFFNQPIETSVHNLSQNTFDINTSSAVPQGLFSPTSQIVGAAPPILLQEKANEKSIAPPSTEALKYNLNQSTFEVTDKPSAVQQVFYSPLPQVVDILPPSLLEEKSNEKSVVAPAIETAQHNLNQNTSQAANNLSGITQGYFPTQPQVIGITPPSLLQEEPSKKSTETETLTHNLNQNTLEVIDTSSTVPQGFFTPLSQAVGIVPPPLQQEKTNEKSLEQAPIDTPKYNLNQNTSDVTDNLSQIPQGFFPPLPQVIGIAPPPLAQEKPNENSILTALNTNFAPPPIGFDNIVKQTFATVASTSEILPEVENLDKSKNIELKNLPLENISDNNSTSNFFSTFYSGTSNLPIQQAQNSQSILPDPLTFFDSFAINNSQSPFSATAPALETADEEQYKEAAQTNEDQLINNFFNNPPPKESGSGVGDLNYDLVHTGLAVKNLHTRSLTPISNVVEPPSSSCSEFSELNNSAVLAQKVISETEKNKIIPQKVCDSDKTDKTENINEEIKHYEELPEEILQSLRMANLLISEKGDATAPPATIAYTAAIKHWFYKRADGNKFVWTPFSHYDSALLETSLIAGSDVLDSSTQLVAVEGGRYDVNISARSKVPVYWEGDPIEVRRCSWFYKATDSNYIPYDEETAELLEKEYKQAAESGVWHRKIVITGGELVVFHGPTVIVHFQQQKNTDAWGGTSQVTSRPRVVKRDLDDFVIEQGESQRVDHLLLMVHGIGAACDLKMRAVEEVVDDFRTIAQQLVQSHYKNSTEMGIVGRVEVLPISWHSDLHSEEMGIDEKLKSITLESIPKLRNFTNDTLLDILFYTSPTYCQKIINTVVQSMNNVYMKYRERHPEFSGGVSVGGHSLGSLIMFDLLCHQKPIKESEEQNMENPDSFGSPVSLIPQKEISAKQISYTMGPAGTGQPYINYAQLIFQPKKFFALGSPIGMFVTVRGIDKLGLDFRLPTCCGFYNIFHPFDPVAYRIEALVNPDMSPVRPVLIPHHKGRKRMHLELKETMTRVGADLKARFLDTFKTTLNSVYSLGFKTKKEEEEAMAKEVDKVLKMQLQKEEDQQGREHKSPKGEPMDQGCQENERTNAHSMKRSRVDSFSTISSDTETPDIDIPLGKLNDSKRIDYVLQEAPLEFFNEYIFALSSHVCYWESEDTILFIMKEIYSGLGVSPDSQVPQQTMTIERPSSQNSISQSILSPMQ